MSFAALALAVAGAGVLVLALTALAVALLPLPPAGRAVVALAGVAQYPARVKCALLGWMAFKDALGRQTEHHQE